MIDALTITLNPAIDWTVTVNDFAVGQVNRAAGETAGAGGKGINVAALLADCGLAVAATGFVGRENDEQFRQLFVNRAIEDRMIRLDGKTRIGIKIVDDAGRETTDINFPGLAPSDADLNALFAQIDSIKASWVVLAGSLPPGVQADIYGELARRAKVQGCRVALDSSGEALRCALGAARDAVPHLVKPNLAELQEWAGAELASPTEIYAAARQIIARGVEQVAVSMGKEGLILVDEAGAIWAKTPSIEVGSTVGAGDALLAGLVAATNRGLSRAERARQGVAFSLDVLTRHHNYQISPASVEAWKPQISLSALPARRAESVEATPPIKTRDASSLLAETQPAAWESRSRV